MSLSNCKQCGGLYIRLKSSYCEKCQKEQDQYYFKLRDFMKLNPNSSVMDAHQRTGIPLSKLLELRKEEYVPFGR
jgi:hypothetical protein